VLVVASAAQAKGHKPKPDNNRVDKADFAWKGETGHITAEMLSSQLSTLQGSICYIAGRTDMVSSARAVLNEVGVDDDDIQAEKFACY
jgi:NAD(P)H-flavin reductase